MVFLFIWSARAPGAVAPQSDTTASKAISVNLDAEIFIFSSPFQFAGQGQRPETITLDSPLILSFGWRRGNTCVVLSVLGTIRYGANTHRAQLAVNMEVMGGNFYAGPNVTVSSGRQ